MALNIHPTAVVSKDAVLGENVEIGAFSVVGSQVTLGEGVKLDSHVVIEGQTSVGAKTQVYPFAVIGKAPQDLKYAGEPSRVEIGTSTVIREHVTIHRGTEGGGLLTKVGDSVLLMNGVHIAHDAFVGNHVIIASNGTLAGHVHVGDYAVIGGLSAVHQFTHIGESAMVGGMTGIRRNVVPYSLVAGLPASCLGVNLVGLKRRDFEKKTIYRISDVMKDLLEEGEKSLEDKLADLETQENPAEIQKIITFMRTHRSRGFHTIIPGLKHSL